MARGKYNISPEMRAIMSERMKARWANNRARMLEISRRGGVNCGANNPNKWPERGTEERRLFCKIVNCTNAATAHAHFARVRP